MVSVYSFLYNMLCKFNDDAMSFDLDKQNKNKRMLQ